MKTNYWKIVLGVLVLAGMVAAYGLLMPRGEKVDKVDTKANSSPTVKVDPANVPVKDATTTDTLKVEENSTTKDKTKTTDPTKDPKTTDVSTGSNPTGVTPEVRFVRTTVEGSPVTVSIRAQVDKVTTGKCELSATQGAEKVTKVGTVKADATTSICDGIDIPFTDFPKGGEWLMSLIVTSGDKTSAPATQTLTLEK
jgi:hypothetical protein